MHHYFFVCVSFFCLVIKATYVNAASEVLTRDSGFSQPSAVSGVAKSLSVLITSCSLPNFAKFARMLRTGLKKNESLTRRMKGWSCHQLLNSATRKNVT